MKTLKISIFIIFLLVILPCEAYLQGSGQPSDKELLEEFGQVKVRVLVTSVQEPQPCKAASSWRWGAENTCPKTFISALEIKMEDKPIFIPISAFADLGNPRTVRIEPCNEKHCFVVTIVGGDAATSYSARLEFKNNLLNKRLVRHGEFPKESWEETIYKFKVAEN
jgi:hypothetical protein